MSIDTAIQKLHEAISRFITIPPADWELLLPHLQFITISRQEYFAREGRRENKVGFILDGSMRHFYTRDGEERTTYFYFEGHFVSAYISCISGKPSELTIEALTDCTLLVFPYSAMYALFNQSQAWERFGRLIAEYLALGLEERMVSLLMLSPEERYVQLINSNKQKIIERIPQHYIANYLGITPVSLSRIRARLANV